MATHPIEETIQATIYPENRKVDAAAEVRLTPDSLQVSFPEYREDFRELMHKLHMKWNSWCWERRLRSWHGVPQDRAAETGHRILLARFPIRIFDQTIREKAIAGSYEPEHTRWVLGKFAGNYEGWFAIKWARDEDFYKAAKRIPGSRYCKPDVVAPPDKFEYVLDFAKMYDFHISETARSIADTARETRSRILVVKVGPAPEQLKINALSKPPKLEVPSDVNIAAEFAD